MSLSATLRFFPRRTREQRVTFSAKNSIVTQVPWKRRTSLVAISSTSMWTRESECSCAINPMAHQTSRPPYPSCPKCSNHSWPYGQSCALFGCSLRDAQTMPLGFQDHQKTLTWFCSVKPLVNNGCSGFRLLNQWCLEV